MTEPVAYRWKFEDEPDSEFELRKRLPKWYDAKNHVDIVMEGLYTKSPYINFFPIEDLPKDADYIIGWSSEMGALLVYVGSNDGERRFYDQMALEYCCNYVRVYPTHYALWKTPDVQINHD